jgi:CubicO group peptidase (beta-lactamase class C family)
MRPWLTSAAAVLVVAWGCGGTTTGEPLVLSEDEAARLQATLDASVADGGIPGAQAAVVFPDGAVWSGAAGDASRQAGEDITTETRFPIASITKLFTATTILRLAERGELSLDDSVTAWLPDETIDGRVTIRQLLNHTGGLPGEAESICEPGTCVNYSGVGYGLLGQVIEAVTGDTLAHAYRTEITGPLALSTTVLGTQEAVDGPQATGNGPEGPLEPAHVIVRQTFPSSEGNNGSSGAMVSTARDVAVFATKLFRGELLEAPKMSEMLDFDASRDLAGADECRARGLGVLRESADTEYGLAWGHNGILNGFTAAVRYYPAYDITVAVLVNTTIGGGAQATEELLALELLDGLPPIDADRGRGRCVQDVFTIRPDGSDLSNVTDDARIEWSVTWSPDSRRLMFGTALEDNNDLYVIDRNGSGLERVTETPGLDGAASWSPDGTRIVFERERAGDRVLYTATADGSEPVELTEGRLASWSPRGGTIAYSRPRPDGELDLWLIDDDGTDPRPLVTDHGDELWASWSPDASAIVFAVDGTLAIVDVATRAITPIAVDRDVIGDAPLEFASWGPTGRIAFITGSDIWTVGPDGTDPLKVGGAPGRDFVPAWSPDNDLIAFIGGHWHD